MSNLSYKKILFEDDIDVPQLKAIFRLPEIARYLCIGDNYFQYVINTENVCFYKIYENAKLIGSIHLEKQGTTLFMDILVFPEFQGTGLGTKIVKDIQDDIFGMNYESIDISIDERNTASLTLFENAGFVRTSKEDELINYRYQRRNN